MARQALKAGAKVSKADTRPSDATTLSPSGMAEVPLRTSALPLGTVVRWAVKCLYCEEVLPRGPLLQWYLGLLLGVKLNHKDLRTIIDSEDGFYAEPSSSRKLNFYAVLKEEPKDFKGFVTDSDVVETLTEELWEEAAICLSQGGWPKADDVAHKYYVVASWLQDVSEKFRAWSFGRVLVVVRFAAQADCLLGHRAGLLVPYEHSEECERCVNAQKGLPTHIQDGEAYVKSWQELQECLHRLLHKSQVLEVSKLKIMFRTVLNLELSETVFGHQCLSRLLADEQLGEDFKLEMCQGNRYMLGFNKTHAKWFDPPPSTSNGNTGAAAKSVSVPIAVAAAGSSGMSAKERAMALAAASGDRKGRWQTHKDDVSLKPQPPPPPGPPPGLAMPKSSDGYGAPPGLDLNGWPTPGVATKADAQHDKPDNGGGKSLGPPPGLTPEKMVKMVETAETASNKTTRTWAMI